MFLISGHHDQYDIISSWEVEQNQAVKAATQGKASPAKIQTPGNRGGNTSMAGMAIAIPGVLHSSKTGDTMGKIR